MVKKIIYAALIGGIIAFIWGNISWVAMDWHLKTVELFKDETVIAKAIKDNAPQAGVYFLPQMHPDLNAKPAAEQKTINDALQARYKEGPRAFIAVSHGPGDTSMTKEIIQYFFTFIGYAFAIALLLTFCSCGNYFYRVLYVGFLGLLMGSYGELLAVNWFHYSWEFALLNALDGLIGWTLAGFAMAAIINRSAKVCN